MAQMRMGPTIAENLKQTISYMEQAKASGADLIFFPEVQLSPFFPQYENRDAAQWLLTEDSAEIRNIRETCKRLRLWACPNIYLELDGKRFDASIMIDGNGAVTGISQMVHIAQAKYFYEQDYYAPSDDGFKVYDTPFGKIGVVICFDRHLPDSIRSCAQKGAELVIIPTANIDGEPLELFEWEVRVQSFQNTVFAAMCNRVGKEDKLTFAGQSLLAGPDGDLLFKAGAEEGLFVVDVMTDQVHSERLKRQWLLL